MESARVEGDDADPWIVVMRRRRAARVLGSIVVALGALLVLGLLRTSVTAHAITASVDAPEPDPSWYERAPKRPASVTPTEPTEPTESGDAQTDSNEPDPRLEPASRPARKLLALKDEIQASLTYTAYEHRTKVRPKEGIYVWDCSAMAGWMLRKIAPKARKAMNKGRPVARDYYRKIKRSPTRRARDGWRRLDHIEDVRPGDMFSWERPPGFPSRNTGHVGFAIGPAREVPEWPGAYTIRIVDATSLPHQDDTRERDDGGGIGEGTILFMTDGNGHGTGYGWFGQRSRGVIVTPIGFARLSR